MKLSLNRRVSLALSLAVGIIFWALAHRALTPALNYTFAISSALLHAQLGLTNPPAWLNELVPGPGGLFFSVFPLGAVLSVLPFSALVAAHILPGYPVMLVVGLLAGASAALAYGITFIRPDFSQAKRLMLALWLVAGSWYMTNLLFAGGWQLALGFAVLGELAAIYWSVVKPRPLLAGLGLAVAFGNRTEILLAAPIILAYLLRSAWPKISWPTVVKFSIFPIILGLLTLIYNYVRFGSLSDFGYARLPGILNEPWYQHGIFSLSAVGENARQMLTQSWHYTDAFAFPVPTAWGGSIILASPFLLLLLRKPHGDRLRVLSAWAAVIMLTSTLWIHGNTGGWQYSYRYALTLLPWFLVLFVEYLPGKITKLEALLWALSIIISAYATWLFLFTRYVA
ncbi:MAG: hypothetical protein NVSMB39_0240 [Candidatus Saccharimonadales bacterium]